MHRFASVALVDARGWVLMQERDENPVLDPEKWGFPGGGVEPGESYEQAAYRELEEETGVALAPGDLTLVGEFTFFSTPCGTHDRFGLYAAARDLSDADIVCGEGRRMVFVDPDAARTLDLTESAVVGLPAFLDSDLYTDLRRSLTR